MWREFVELAEKRQEPFISLCARFGISRKTGYKWLNRFRQGGDAGLAAQSRRPKHSPRRTPSHVVDAILALRRENPDWSAARIHAALQQRGISPLPAPSTIDLTLRRQREAAAAQNRLLGPDALRLEPNYCWVLRISEAVVFANGSTAGAAYLRDETTGFIVAAAVLGARRDEALRALVENALRRHGLPWRISIPSDPALRLEAPTRSHSPLTVWLMRIGVAVDFRPAESSAPRQAQLSAKLASLPGFQRTVLRGAESIDLLDRFHAEGATLDPKLASERLQQLRDENNFAGRQEAMQRRGPVSVYRNSDRALPREISMTPSTSGSEIRLVSEKGIFTFQRRLVHVGRAFAGFCVELQETPYPDKFIVLFAGQVLGVADLTEESGVATSLQLRPSS